MKTKKVKMKNQAVDIFDPAYELKLEDAQTIVAGNLRDQHDYQEKIDTAKKKSVYLKNMDKQDRVAVKRNKKLKKKK
jgi:hypothetical protein